MKLRLPAFACTISIDSLSSVQLAIELVERYAHARRCFMLAARHKTLPTPMTVKAQTRRASDRELDLAITGLGTFDDISRAVNLFPLRSWTAKMPGQTRSSLEFVEKYHVFESI
jgi:hypothetical protein